MNAAGELQLRPGVPTPGALRSTRPDWADRLGNGLPAHALPDALAALFNLCGHSHRACSRLALHALGAHDAPHADALAAALRRETALEHVRRIGLDWPRLLAPQAGLHGAAIAALRRCPLNDPAARDPWGDMAAWLDNELLRVPARSWLTRWHNSGTAWLQAWSTRHDGWLASLLAQAQPNDRPLPWQDSVALHAATDGLADLDEALAHEPGFAARPHWHGRPAHTGSWQRATPVQTGLPVGSWGLLGARLAELARLSLATPAEASPLTWGAQRRGERGAIAWVEMARGLLVHRVVLDAAGSRVAACQVVAPTDWNFHPEGVAARAVSALRGSATAGAARLLVAAFDPCVPFDIVQETAHA